MGERDATAKDGGTGAAPLACRDCRKRLVDADSWQCERCGAVLCLDCFSASEARCRECRELYGDD